MKEKFIALLTFTSSLKNFGIKFIRVAILVVFVWIGGLKYFHYEADGIVPFVANSPFMSFFYAKDAPEYKDHKNPEGAFVPENRAWHEANRTKSGFRIWVEMNLASRYCPVPEDWLSKISLFSQEP